MVEAWGIESLMLSGHFLAVSVRSCPNPCNSSLIGDAQMQSPVSTGQLILHPRIILTGWVTPTDRRLVGWLMEFHGMRDVLLRS